jgi:alkanesulfonate monooxygenase
MSQMDEIEPEFGWYMPTRGDGPYVGVKSERVVDTAYQIKVAQAVEEAGYTFALIPTGGNCSDAWIVGATLAAHTKIFKPLVAMRPGLIAPALAARIGATLDEVTGGRALINIVTGSSPADMLSMGDELAFDKDARYERTLEYIKVVKQLWINSAAERGDQLLAAHDAFKHIEPLDHASSILLWRQLCRRQKNSGRNCRCLPDVGGAAGLDQGTDR